MGKSVRAGLLVYHHTQKYKGYQGRFDLRIHRFKIIIWIRIQLKCKLVGLLWHISMYDMSKYSTNKIKTYIKRKNAFPREKTHFPYDSRLRLIDLTAVTYVMLSSGSGRVQVVV